MNQNNSLDNLLQQGHLQLERGQYEAGLEIFQQANNLFPNNAPIKYALGLACFRLEQDRESIEHLDNALQLQLIYPLARVTRGKAYKQLKQTEQANADFEAVLQIEPQTHENWRARGIAFDELKQPESALECYDKVLEIEASDHQSWHNKGLILQNLQRFAEALECFDRALEILPNKFSSIMWRGCTLSFLQRHQEAIDSYDKCLQLKPDDHLILTNQSFSLAQTGKKAEAIVNCDVALKIKPKCDSTWYIKGVILLSSEYYYEALYCYQKASKIKPDFDLYSEAKSTALLKVEQFKNQSLDSFAWYIRGNMCVGINAYQESFFCYKKALEIASSNDINDNFSDSDWKKLYLEAKESILIQFKNNRLYKNKLFPKSKELGFLLNMLSIIGYSGLHIDRFFKHNLDKLTLNLAWELQVWANITLPTLEPPQQKSVADDIVRFSCLIHNSSVGNRKINLEIAIAALKTTLIVTTRSNLPEDWAKIQFNLGVAYQNRTTGDKKKNIGRAIRHLNNALIVTTPQNDLYNCLKISKNLGNLAFYDGMWQIAVDAYLIAIEAIEKSQKFLDYKGEFQAMYSGEFQAMYSKEIKIFHNIIQAYINLEKLDGAIECVERGKARNLVNLLSALNLYPKGNVPDNIINRLSSLRKEIIIEQIRIVRELKAENKFINISKESSRQKRSGYVKKNGEMVYELSKFDRLHYELKYLVEKDIQPIDPSFKLTQQVEAINYKEIKESLPDKNTVLIEWYLADESTLFAFLVTAQDKQPLLISYSNEESESLQKLFKQYLDTYLDDYNTWNLQLNNLLAEIAVNLKLVTIINRVTKLVPNCDRLILVPHRWLHLLPIHALPVANDRCLLDLFPQGVSFAPSVQLLKLSSKQSKPTSKSLFAIQNPTEDLDFTNIEVQAIRSQFQPNDDVFEKDRATKLALTPEKLAKTHIAHFSCHGYFNFENPELSALLMAGSKVEQGEEIDRGAEEQGARENKNTEKKRFLPSRDGGNIDLEKCLTLGEIFGLDLHNCRLVTLSACETGLTDFKSLSDEYIGLPSGFLYAGSPSVVSSLWAVSDLSTTFLMIKFYQNLPEMDSVAIALNQAQLWLRDLTKEELAEWKTTANIPDSQMWKIDKLLMNMPDRSRPFSSPYHWGAFCAVGS